MTIAPEIQDIIRGSSVEGVFLKLAGDLDRATYVATNKVLELLGGKWDKKAKAHRFESCPLAKMEAALDTGHVTDAKKEFQFFPTPAEIADRMVFMACIERGDRILEPSAGHGGLLDACLRAGVEASFWAVELMPENRAVLAKRSDTYLHDEPDFLRLTADSGALYDRILMNPPFSNLQDVEHVAHALTFLRPGGTLVAIMSPAITFRQDKKVAAFLDLLRVESGIILFGREAHCVMVRRVCLYHDLARDVAAAGPARDLGEQTERPFGGPEIGDVERYVREHDAD